MSSLLSGLILAVMLSFCAAKVQIGNFTCVNSETWPVTGDFKVKTVDVVFPEPYKTVPKVHLSIVHLDTDKTKTLRVKTYVSGITNTGFKAIFTTWYDSVVKTAIVSWLSIES
uniref:H-type lectin domain-containing protein n=1 Tax=Arion vulgaris TaxID=1028688 RepID=A0A0B7B7G5_9EUPU